MYKHQKEHSRVEENGHGFGQKNIGMKIEQGDVMRSKTEWGLGIGDWGSERGLGFGMGIGVRNGDWGGRHETK